MSTFKKSQVVILPTQKGSNILTTKAPSKETIVLFYSNKLIEEGIGHQPQHLYFLSDEEPKGGDWVYHPIHNTIYQWIKNAHIKFDRIDAKKIIATTDTLGISNLTTGKLPNPSKEFIEVFISEYNKGNIITEVMVEYETATNQVPNGKTIDWLKVNPKDNTITIRKVKDSWSRKEVEEKLNDLHLFIRANAISDNSVRILISKMVKEWIKENL